MHFVSGFARAVACIQIFLPAILAPFIGNETVELIVKEVEEIEVITKQVEKFEAQLC